MPRNFGVVVGFLAQAVWMSLVHSDSKLRFPLLLHPRKIGGVLVKKRVPT